MPSPSARDANWIDGLRGIASLFVVIGHLCTSFAPHLHSPTMPDSGPTLFQLPFFRLVVGGRTAVAIFFIVTGYVNAVGTLSKAAAGDLDAAFTTLSRSALARPGKLILPAAIATFFSWTMSQVGAYRMTQFADAKWIRQGHHAPAASRCDAIQALFKAEIGTWTGVWDETYDGTQWTLIYFLEGSMIVYITICATLLVKRNARLAVFAALWIYGWLSAKTVLKTMNIAIGMSLASLQANHGKVTKSLLPSIFPPLLIVIGLFLSSYPQDSPETAPWSESMRSIMSTVTPIEADLRRYWDSLGATLIFTGIFFSETARRILSTRFCNFLV